MKIGIELNFLTQKNTGELLKSFEDIYIDFDHDNGYNRNNTNIWLLSYNYSCKLNEHNYGYELASAVGDLEYFDHSIDYLKTKLEKEKLIVNENCEFHINISDDDFKNIFESEWNKLFFSLTVEKELKEKNIIQDYNNNPSELIKQSLTHWIYFTNEQEIITMADLEKKEFIDRILRIINSFYPAPFSYSIPYWKSPKSLVNYSKFNENIIELKLKKSFYDKKFDQIRNFVKNEIPHIINQTKQKNINDLYLNLFQLLVDSSNMKIDYEPSVNPYEFIYR